MFKEHLFACSPLPVSHLHFQALHNSWKDVEVAAVLLRDRCAQPVLDTGESTWEQDTGLPKVVEQWENPLLVSLLTEELLWDVPDTDFG